jgi:hypothetical protein
MDCLATFRERRLGKQNGRSIILKWQKQEKT